MKRAFALVVLIVTPTITFPQGTIIFQNRTGLVTYWSGIPVPAGNAMVELIAAPVGTVLPNPEVTGFATLSSFLAANPGWAPGTALPGYSYSNPGGLYAAGLFNNGVLSLELPHYGANAEYFVIGWTGPNGGPLGAATTYDVAYALGTCWFGQSLIFTTETADPTLSLPAAPVPLYRTFGGITLGIPEPSNFALAGLGAVLLVLFCRRG